MTERQEQMIYNEGYRRGKAERHKMLDDGTLVVSVDDATAVTRVLVEDGQKNGDLYYADRPRGEWIAETKNYHSHWVCSECGAWALLEYNEQMCLSNFCPNCGADMKGADDEID